VAATTALMLITVTIAHTVDVLIAIAIDNFVVVLLLQVRTFDNSHDFNDSPRESVMAKSNSELFFFFSLSLFLLLIESLHIIFSSCAHS
jgi:hypothetical protein